VIFVYGLILCGIKVWRYSVELNDLKAGTPRPDSHTGRFINQTENARPESRTIQAEALRLKLTDGIVDVRHIANALVLLGLIGTVIGFIIALSGVNPAEAKSADAVAGIVTTLINGMSVALYTTLVGAVLHIWLIVNYRILTSGTVDLIASTIQMSESRARN
jgi:biopolymer transport protein ExbB/TolQ